MSGQTAKNSVTVGMGAELTVTAEAVEKYGSAAIDGEREASSVVRLVRHGRPAKLRSRTS